MSRATGHGPQVPLGLAAALTTWLTLWSWEGFVVDAGSYLAPTFFGVFMVAGVGMLCRYARLPVVLVVAAEVLLVVLLANLMWGSSVLPWPDSLAETLGVLADGVDESRRYAAPVPASATGVTALLVVGGLACHLLVDLIAVTLLRVPIAGLPLLTIYSLPVSILQDAVPWFTFVVGAAGFLLMLALQEEDRVARWGRPVDVGAEPGSNLGVRSGRHHPLAVGASATVLAVIVPLLLPTLDLDVLAGPGGVGGSGDRTVRITNPMTDLRRDLVEGPDVPFVRIRTDGSAPSYMRIAALTTFTGEAWTAGGRDLPADQAATGRLPEPPGLARSVPREPEEWDVSISQDFKSLWLPIPLFVQAVDANDDEWRYDTETLDIHAASDDLDTAGVDYSLTALDVEHDSADMIDAPPAPERMADRYTRLPADMPEIVERLAREVTSRANSDFERAVALQDWFRDSGDFEYSTDPAKPDEISDLVRFLSDGPGGRIGYCEQFASAMAVMTRSLGIPTRVAVGFLNSERSNGDWVFSRRDMHAWPELYFEGSGWMRFEPTPPDRETSAPGYTDLSVPSAEPFPRLSDNASAQPTPSARPDVPGGPTSGDAADDSSPVPLVPVLVLGGLVLLVALGVLGVRALRRSRASRRWRELDPAEAAWAELHDSAVDLGFTWPSGKSPRSAAELLTRKFAAEFDSDQPLRPMRGPDANPEATDALDRIVLGIEFARYSAEGTSGEPIEQMQADVDTCVGALRAGVRASVRRRADWLPRSVLSGRTAVVPQDAATRVRSDQDVVDHVG